MRESVAAKADRLLTDGRLRVLRCGDDTKPGLVVAECVGDSGERYSLGWDPGKRQFRCTCPELRGRCSHIGALRKIVIVERTTA